MAITAFEVLAKLGLDTSGYEDDLNGALKDTEGKVSKAAGGFGKVMGTAGKVIAGATTAAATAVGALATQSVNAYKDYEQLEGGIETLFGDAAPKVMANAEKAFQSAGMSMNQYMDTSIQSAAAMIKSLEGTENAEEEAAKLMDVSITDMADNVNKMGTSMEGVQNAYRGFSRGNFTMLDNLALGFAGTKEGMQELLDKAKEISGVEYNIDSYADIVKAIHAVQGEMGISGRSAEDVAEIFENTGKKVEESLGTTAKEGAETLSGSLDTLKGAWQNLVAGFGKEDVDLGALIDSVVEAASTVLDNIQPILERTLEGIGNFVSQAAPIIAEQLPQILEGALPSLLNAAIDLVNSLLEALPGILSALTSQIPAFVTQIAQMLQTLAPKLITSVMEIVRQLAVGIADALPEIIEAITNIVIEIANALTDPDMLTKLLSAALWIIEALAQGLLEALPKLIEALPQIIQNIVDFLVQAAPMIIGAAGDIVMALVQALPTIIASLIEALPQIINSIIEGLLSMIENIVDVGIELFLALVDGLPEAITQIAEHLPELIDGIINAILEGLPMIIDAGIQLFSALVENMPAIIEANIKAIPQLGKAIIGAILKLGPQMTKAGIDLMVGLAKGIAQGAIKAAKAAIDAGKKVVDGVKKLFKINSPSKLFEQFGQYLDEGMAIGITGNVDKVSNAMNELRDATEPIEDDFGNEWSTTSLTSSNGNIGAPGASQQQITAILELDRVQLGKAIFTLNNEETQRIGLNLANGGY